MRNRRRSLIAFFCEMINFVTHPHDARLSTVASAITNSINPFNFNVLSIFRRMKQTNLSGENTKLNKRVKSFSDFSETLSGVISCFFSCMRRVFTFANFVEPNNRNFEDEKVEIISLCEAQTFTFAEQSSMMISFELNDNLYASNQAFLCKNKFRKHGGLS